jgi:hypothetical protein
VPLGEKHFCSAAEEKWKSRRMRRELGRLGRGYMAL